ncbi:MAG: hypothetical protein QOI81_761 [Actinomycetota bacterium]|nr:hypothetical protein [Actinomycetota bacterium]
MACERFASNRVEFVQTHPRLGVKSQARVHIKKPNAGMFLHSAATPGPISPNPKVYVVFWGNQWSSDPAGAAPALQAFFRGLYGSADTWGTVMSQYCEGLPAGTSDCETAGIHIVHPTKTPLAGVWFDNATAAPSKSSQAQIGAEAAAAAAHFGNTTKASNANAQYVIASATGTHPDGFPKGGFCGWHSSVSSTSGTLAYTNLPYVPDLGVGVCTTLANASPLDGYFSTESHEYNESVTDLWPSMGWLTKNGYESADLCISSDARLTLKTGTFDVQGVWSNSANSCVTRG